MYATVRCDAGTPDEVEQVTRAGRALTVALGQVPGFISCVVLNVGDGAIVSISICEDRAALTMVDRTLADWLATRLTAASGSRPQITTGEVMAQKGL